MNTCTGRAPGLTSRLIKATAQSVLIASFATAVSAQGEPTEPREAPAAAKDWFRPETEPGQLRVELGEADSVSDRWIYHDLDAAREQARREKKPVLAVFRCVPCGSAPGLDAALCTAGGGDAAALDAELRAAGGELAALLDKFVAVRVVKMNGVNRHVFQFDRDVPYVAMMLNADGTVYGRYGTRVSQDRKNLARHNLTSFRKTLERALELHENYPQNRNSLLSKLGAAAGSAFTEDMPTFEPFPEKFNPVVKNCIHCHTVGEAEVRQTLTESRLSRRDVFPYPRPENLGVRIDINDGLRIESVREESAGARAGLQSGDVLTTLAGQPLTSEADVQWALHHAPDEGEIPVVVRRDGQDVETTLALEGTWRRGESHWRASLSPLRPNVHLRPDPYKAKKGARPDGMGLEVRYPRETAAEAGLRNGDLLVAVDGRTDLHLEADLLRYIHLEQPDKQSVELTVVREGRELTVTLPLRKAD